MAEKTVTLKLIKSRIGATERQKRTLLALGLRKLNQEVTRPANAAVLGMLDKIQRWVEVK